MLDMPQRALAILQSRPEWATMQFEASFLTGEALRACGRFRDALKPLELAASLRPGHLGVAMALGWCYKRTNRLAQAIEALERAGKATPEEPLIHYNLACYWSLARNSARAIDSLTTALDLEPELLGRLSLEPDFDPIRGSAEFRRLEMRAVC